ncbi:putative ribonuclease H-like domain-containing protein [Tanacetum coccineum]
MDNTYYANESEEQLFERFSPFKNTFTLPPVPNISSMDNIGIFGNAYYDEDVEEEVDMNNTRHMTKINEEHGLISSVHKLRRTTHKDFQNCLFACFLSQMPKKPVQALKDPSWVEAMQDELLQFKLLKVWTLVDLPRDKWAIGTKWVLETRRIEKKVIVVKNKARPVYSGQLQEEGIDYDEVFSPVARIEAIRLFLAYASFKDFFLLLVYFTAAKLMLGSVNAVRHMLMLPVQVPAAEGVSINTSIKDNCQGTDGVRQLQAIVDKKRVIVTESSIRRDLHLDDAKGTDCLPIATIFEEPTRMGAKSTAWNEFNCSMDSLIICLAINQKFNMSKYIFDAMVKHLDGGVKFLRYPRFLQVFINQQLRDMSTHKKIFVNPFHTKKVFANMKRDGNEFSRRITHLFATMMVQVSEEVGEDSDHLTDSTQVPILDQPSTCSKPKKKQTSKKTQRQEAEIFQDETEHEESVPTPSNDPKPSGEDSMQLTDLMVLCTKLQIQVLDLEKAKDAQAKEIVALKKRIQKLERKKMSRPTGLKRLKKVGMSRRVESSEDQESLVAPEDASKQRRSIANIDADVEVTLVDETQERQDDKLMFDTGVLDTDEMHVKAKVDEKDEQSTKLDDSTVSEAVTTASVEDSDAPTTIKEITLAQTLIQIKAAKPKVVTTAATTTTTTRPKDKRVVVQELSEFRVLQEAQPSISKDKEKGIMVEPEVPLKRED